MDGDAFWLTWCKEELAKGRAVHLPAKGLSMLPSIWPKTILRLELKAFSDVEVGEVIELAILNRPIGVRRLSRLIRLTCFGFSSLFFSGWVVVEVFQLRMDEAWLLGELFSTK